MLKTLALALLLTATYGLRLHLAFLALGTDVDPVGCLFLGALVSVSSVIALTPASLGVREAVGGWSPHRIWTELGAGAAPPHDGERRRGGSVQCTGCR